jgi:hypothetical protein
MNMARLPLVPALVLPLLAGFAAAAMAQDDTPPQEHYGLRLEYREYRPTATGDLQMGASGEAGTLLDIVDDLGIQDERTFDARVIFKIKTKHKLKGGYMPIDYAGDQDAPRNFTFKDTEYFRDDRVATTIKGAVWSGDYGYEFYQGPHGFVGALLGARIMDVDIVVVDVDSAERETDSSVSPLPVIGIEGRGYAGKLSLEAEFAGLSIGSLGSYYEFEGSARFHISDRLAVMGGYRLLSAKAKEEPDLFKLRMSGWQFGLELSL